MADEAPPVRPEAPHDPYAALRFRDFRFLLIGNFISSFGGQMLSFAISWELWLRTHSAFALGLVGLVQVIPVILFSLPAGHVADQFNRKRIIMCTQTLLACCALGLALLSYLQGPLFLIYGCLLGIGIVRAFNGPAASTLLPQTVPEGIYTSAVTWSSSTWQFASITGPAVAGLVVAAHGQVLFLYLFEALAVATYVVLIGCITGRPIVIPRKTATLASLKEGVSFIRDTKVLLAAITLDMFAVLFGGAVALLPVYATDILQVGASGLGVMRTAPSVGALIMAFALAHLPPLRQAGKALLWAVTGFGVATIIFGLSKSFLLSVAMLALLGAMDSISVVIRSTLMLTKVPDQMRGRASAVNGIFISTSNELGGFESGSVAALCGPVFSVVSGGIGTIVVVLLVARFWPEMRQLKTL